MQKHIFYPGATAATYKGGCHCKAVRYRVTMPAIEENPVSDCNCSACTAWGKMNMFVWKGDIEIEGEELLKDYQFGEKRVTHKFCPTCSTNLFVYDMNMPGMPDLTGWIALNVRSIDEVEIDKLKRSKFNGRDEV